MLNITTLPTLPERKADTHKGDYGRTLVLAGSVGMTGAACMCSEAVLRGGAGLVTLGIPESLYPIVASSLSFAVMTHPLPETMQKTLSYRARQKISEVANRLDVLAIGPGLSRNPETQRLVIWLLENIAVRMVIDADALTALAQKPAALEKVKAGCIATPHPGEMARLLGWSSAVEVQRDRAKAVEEFIKRYPSWTLVLKGHRTIVADNQQFYINTTGNPGMATAGTGDVLTGLIAGLIAQGLTTFEAAQLGVYLHGLAGNLASEEKGEVSMIATDVLEKLPEAFKVFLKKQDLVK
ncbi:MAG TPA: NAD(P)H-hydrate dehydratase [Candidatus Hypogeohydataceae bacterium YC41]